ncbi:MAG: hypothetical protein BGO77_06350 [Caedibacter sp. 37-49]|nr:MAG: hypothetical protein BGO77_06350 [Caedibacter sp. 37-49]
MWYFQIFAVFMGLFILSDPFKAETIEEETASGKWQVMPLITAKPKPSETPVQEEKKEEAKKPSPKADVKEAVGKAAADEFKPEEILKAVKATHEARLEETKQREEVRKAAGIETKWYDPVLDVVIPSVKKGGWFIFSELIPRAFNVVVKTAPMWLPILIAAL